MPTATRILQKTIHTRSLLWWRTVQAVAEPSELGWRHPSTGRPCSSWESILADIFGLHWMEVLQHEHQQRFSQFRDAACRRVSVKVIENMRRKARDARSIGSAGPVFQKAPRELDSLYLDWAPVISASRAMVCGDSEVVINWMAGHYKTRKASHRRLVALLHNEWEKLVNGGYAAPAEQHQDFYRHIFRERNKRADALAAEGHGRPFRLQQFQTVQLPCRLLVCFDGSFTRGAGAIGFWIGFSQTLEQLQTTCEPDDWTTVVHGFGGVAADSAMECELLAATVSSLVLGDILRGRTPGSCFIKELGDNCSTSSLVDCILCI